MNTISPASPVYTHVDASRSAAEGLRESLVRFERNVAEVASASSSDRFPVGKLVEQLELVQSVRANARSLQSSNQIIGTILDIKV